MRSHQARLVLDRKRELSRRSGCRALATRAMLVCVLLVVLACATAIPAGAVEVDEVHYSFTGPTSVAIDWRGSATDVSYGQTTQYGSTATGQAPNPMPFSSAGPFREAQITGLAPGTTYHYSIGGGVDRTFTPPPTGNFRFDVIADIGSSLAFSRVAPTQADVAADNPAFVLGVGDLTYANDFGQAQADQHFNDVMVWSGRAAYMPVWGNHDWEHPDVDDLRNYKGRFALPNAQTSSDAPAAGCCGEDWGWFDAGGVRFISYPEPYTDATWSSWQPTADSLMAAAQADPSIRYVVTFGHRPAYSTGFHSGDPRLAPILDGLGDRYPKYVLNFNGHSHDYERFAPIHRVTHITAAGGGANLELPWSGSDPRTAYRAMHLEHVRVNVDAGGIRIETVCGPSTPQDDLVCVEGTVIDSYTIDNPAPAPPPPSTLYVDRNNGSCSDTGSGTAAQPFCTISAAAARTSPGMTVMVSGGTYTERVAPKSGTANSPVVFAAVPGDTVTITGRANGFYVSQDSWITIQGFNITGTIGEGFYITKSSNIKLHGNHVSYSGQPASGQTAKGIRLATVTNSIVSGNTVDHNTDYGIYLQGSSANEITQNRVFNNAKGFERVASGIRLYNSTDNTISSNITHHNEDSGIEFDAASNNCLVVNNVSYDNGDHGIDDLASTGERIVGNTVYRNVAAGINVEGNSTGATLANNIAVDNGIRSPRTHSNIRVESGSTSGTTMNHDLVQLTTPDTLLIWSSVDYTSLASFRSATGQEAQGIQADPRWRSPGTGDFELTAGSPAIDSANSGASGQSSEDVNGDPRINDQSTPNTGVGPRAYDDRGAYEFQAPEFVDAPPNATLSVSPGSGTAPLPVTADASGSTDTDMAPIATYLFDFGDGSAAVGPQAGATANHTYVLPGTYTVTVTVTDTAGMSSTATTQVTVSANDAPPAATLSVTPGSGTAPLPVTADASGSTDTDATPIASYRFDFGDGTAVVGPQAGATANHTYTAGGTHTVTVTVTDTAGQSSTATAQVTVMLAGDDPPSVALTVSPSLGPAPLPVTADASGSTDTDATPIDTYRFDFGDGTVIGPQAGATAGHTYAAAGNYTVTVRVTDTAGLSSTTTAQVVVKTNLVGNPGFETNTSGWNTSGSGTGITLSRVAGGHTGGWAGRLTNTGTTASTCALNDSPDWVMPTSAGTYTGAIWVRADVPGATFKLRFNEYSGNTLAGSAVTLATLTTSWQKVSVAYTIASPGSTLDWNAYVTSAAPGTCFFADDASIMKSNAPDLPPAAALSVSPGSGTTPLPVTANASGSTDTDETPIATYRFDFGDGTVIGPQAGATAGHTYTSAGTYTVTVTVTDTAGLSSTATRQVTVAAPDLSPNAALSVAPSSGTTPLPVTADASGSTDTDATPIATYRFDFGDGTVVGPQAGATAGHTYTSGGAYTVTVTVTDTGGLSSTATRQVTVDAPPAAALSVSPSSGTAPLPVTADASGSTDSDATPIASYRFDFGDGTVVGPQSGATADHTYTSPGTHTVTVNVTDTAGLSSTATRQVTVTAVDEQPPNASLSVTPGSGFAPLPVSADASGSTDTDATPIDTYRFDFGDGTVIGPQAGATAGHTYASAGNYTVTVRVTDTAGLSSTATAQVVAKTNFVGNPGFETNTSGWNTSGSGTGITLSRVAGGHTGGWAAQATNTGTTASTCVLNDSPDWVRQTSAGAYAATLWARADTPGATLRLKFREYSGTTLVGSAVTLATLTTSWQQVSVYYTIGSPGSTLDLNAFVSSAAPGTCFYADDVAEFRPPDDPPNAGLTVTPGTGSASLHVTADASGSTDTDATPIASYRFDFGDGTVVGPQSGATAGHTYTSAGTYTVTVTVTDTGGLSSTATRQVTVDAPPAAALSVSPSSGTAPLPVTADASGSTDTDATPIASYRFDFGDGTVVGPQSGATADHTYTSGGTYTVTVTVTDTGGLSSTATRQVTVAAPDLPPSAALSVSPSSGTSPLPVTADASGSTDTDATPIASYRFDFGDGTAVVGPQAGATADHTYTLPGTHTVTVTVTDTAGQSSTATRQVTVTLAPDDQPPQASLSVTPGSGFTPLQVSADASGSTDTDATPIDTYRFDFGDGTVIGPQSGATASHTYTLAGTYTVTIRVTDTAGQSSTTTAQVVAKTNVVGNPGFETNTSGWNTSGSGTGITLSRVAGGHTGGWAAQATNTGIAPSTCVLNDSPDWVRPTSAGAYAATLWARADTPGATLRLKFREYSGTTLVGSAVTLATLTTSWQQVSVYYTIGSPGSTLDLNAFVSSAVPGTCFYADDVTEFLG